MRVKFVVTGDMERASIRSSMRRFFPRTGDGQEVDYLRPRKVNGTTTCPLDPSFQGLIRADITEMVKAMVAEAVEGSDGRPADLVVSMDDLELANQSQPRVVTQWIRQGVEAEVVRRTSSMTAGMRLRETIRSRCSFHLFVPMTEAYFFGDRSALGRAGVGAGTVPSLVRADVEDFETDDPLYTPLCSAENDRMHRLGHAWWCNERHPKRYLEHLASRSEVLYDEMFGGVAAFEQLNWPAVPADPLATAFARSLFEDLAEAFGVPNPLGDGTTAAETWPPRTARRDQLVLRNL